jgi:hypothetical protein
VWMALMVVALLIGSGLLRARRPQREIQS